MDTLLSLIDFQALISKVAAFVPLAVAALAIFLVFRMGYKISRNPIIQCCKKLKLEQPIIDLMVDRVYKYSILGFGGVMALGQLGIDVGAVLAGLGVAGIAIGFAAQDSLSNIIAGFIIFLDKPFKVGDWVRVGDHFGKVWEITMRSTRIQTLNHTYVVIPNKTIIDEVLDNHSKYGKTRIEVPVGIAYKEDIPTARDVILKAVGELDILEKDPASTVVVNELGDSSVNLVVRVWVDDAEKEKRAFYDALEACKMALDKADIQIPFPHLQLFVDDVEDRVVEKIGACAK